MDRLLDHPKAASFKITALVRSQEKATKLKTIGIDTVVGSNSDHHTLTGLAANSDVVFATVRAMLFLYAYDIDRVKRSGDWNRPIAMISTQQKRFYRDFRNDM